MSILSLIRGTSNATFFAVQNFLSISSINPPCFIIIDNWVFKKFLLTDEPFAKPLQSQETCVLVNNNLQVRLVLSLELLTTFDKRFNVISVPFYIPNFSVLNCKLDNFIFEVLKYYTESFYINIILKQHNTIKRTLTMRLIYS